MVEEQEVSLFPPQQHSFPCSLYVEHANFVMCLGITRLDFWILIVIYLKAKSNKFRAYILEATSNIFCSQSPLYYYLEIQSG